MATKNYLDYTGLTTYDGLIKDYIGDNTGDSKNVTWEEYSQLPESEKKNSNIAYYITDVPDEESKKGYLGTASGELCTFNDGSDLPMPKLEVGIEAVQDLHGYDAPWVGGAGKNKLPSPAEQTINGVTLTHLSDGSIKLTGTPTANIYFDCFAGTFDSTAYVGYRFKVSYIGSSSGVSFRISGSNRASMQDLYDNSVIADNGSGLYFALRVAFDATIPSSGIIIYPMLLSSSETNYDFAPYSNICPISGWDEVNVGVSGVNGWDEEWEKGALSNSTGEPYLTSERVRSKNFIPTKPTTTYYFYAPNTYSSIRVACYDKDKTYLGQSSGWLSVSNNTSFMTPNNTYYIKFVVVKADETYNNDISINYPSTDTSYHAYSGSTYTIDLDGTRYGGKVDLVSGVMTVDRAYVDLGTLNWSYISSDRRSLFTSNDITDYKHTGSNNIPVNAICECFAIVAMGATFVNGQMGMDGDNAKNRTIICDNRYSNASDFKTAMNGVQLVYELATPLTIQLPPTVVKSLRGMNNVTTDVGGLIQLEYWRSGNVQLRMNDYVIAGGNTVAYADVAENIIQTPISTDSEYRILFSGSDSNTKKADSVGKNYGLIYNPNKQAIILGRRSYNRTVGNSSFAMGMNADASGGGSFAQGSSVVASGNLSFAQGTNVTASGEVSHAIGSGSVASGDVSFAQGSGVTASGDYSHAEGTNTEASNDNAHAEGYYTLASGAVSHAEGSNTVASGNISHAEGIGTIAQRAFNHVFGKYNIADTGGASTTGTGTYIEIVGNGTNDTTGRSNARTLDWSGNETLAGNLVLGGTNSDITLSGSGNTWDGTNTSLKAALSSGGVVTQTASDSEVDYYELLFSSTADNTTRTESTRKAQSLLYSPSSRELRITNSDNSSMTKISNGTLEVKYNGSTNTPARAELSVSSAVSIGDGFTGTVQLNDTTGKFMMIGSKNILLLGTGNTWDGTNTSLKDAITALSNRITALGG